MTLKARITEDMKAAMRAGEKDRLSCIRMLQAGIKQREVDERIELDDRAGARVIDKMIKQRKESVTQFQAGNRAGPRGQGIRRDHPALRLPPRQLDNGELDALVREAIASTGAASMKDMGKVMGVLKPKVQGRTTWARSRRASSRRSEV
jgi:uncharacterized protein YqeY